MAVARASDSSAPITTSSRAWKNHQRRQFAAARPAKRGRPPPHTGTTAAKPRKRGGGGGGGGGDGDVIGAHGEETGKVFWAKLVLALSAFSLLPKAEALPLSALATGVALLPASGRRGDLAASM